MCRVNILIILITGFLIFYSAHVTMVCIHTRPISPRTTRIKPPRNPSPIKYKPTEPSQGPVETSTEAHEIEHLNSLLEAVTGEDFSSNISQITNDNLEPGTDQVVEVRMQRNRRLSPVLGIVAPVISEFMGSLIRPLISSISNHPGNSRYKQKLLSRFTHRVLANTPLANSNLERAVDSQLNQNQFNVALQTIRSQEAPLSSDNYLPENFPDHLPLGKTISPQLNEAARIMFVQLTTAIDNLLKKRIRSATQLSTSFSSTVIEQLRLRIQDDHQGQNISTRETQKQLAILEDLVKQNPDQTDLTGLYVCLAVVMGLVTLLLFALNIARNSIVAYMLKLQLRNTPRAGSKSAMRQERLANYHDDEDLHYRTRTCGGVQETNFTVAVPETSARNTLPRRHSARRSRPHSSVHLPSQEEMQ